MDFLGLLPAFWRFLLPVRTQGQHTQAQIPFFPPLIFENKGFLEQQMLSGPDFFLLNIQFYLSGFVYLLFHCWA